MEYLSKRTIGSGKMEMGFVICLITPLSNIQMFYIKYLKINKVHMSAVA